MSGTDAIGIGALAGGVNYIASYPMSPGTGVLEYLADKGEAFEVIVEQAEDEIAAINMCIGAWYAGARAMVTTSGGGFALMEEGVSLSGITETPAVIHIAQRPGPGTGLPTRTEQADLNLAVYAGHGEFPRIVLAPGSMEDGVLLTQKAFYLADKYQVPVFILSDQYYVDSNCTISPISLSADALESFVVESNSDYLRYRFTENGISPRSIPGFGEGLVKVDSDEHDERGSITEDFNMRIKMNDKRLSREALILNDYIDPELIGSKEYKQLVVGWGSSYGVLKEAVESSGNKDLAFLHIKEVFPLSPKIKTLLSKAEQIVIFENNATAQLANLIKLQLDVTLTNRVLKYNGLPFTIEEVDTKIKEVFQ
jgi:2-oxoglutarate ferredoxin oxidoreductase subunit alpha